MSKDLKKKNWLFGELALNGRLSLVDYRITAVETTMNDFTAESSEGMLDMFHTSILRILHGILHHYPYKLQSLP